MQTKQFEIIGNCNLDCEYCYNKKERRYWGTIPKHQVLKQSGKANLIFLGGGETSLYQEIESLIENLLKKTIVLC